MCILLVIIYIFIILHGHTLKHLRISELRILRKIFEQVQNGDRSWRVRMNYELNELIENADIVRFT